MFQEVEKSFEFRRSEVVCFTYTVIDHEDEKWKKHLLKNLEEFKGAHKGNAVFFYLEKAGVFDCTIWMESNTIRTLEEMCINVLVKYCGRVVNVKNGKTIKWKDKNVMECLPVNVPEKVQSKWDLLLKKCLIQGRVVINTFSRPKPERINALPSINVNSI